MNTSPQRPADEGANLDRLKLEVRRAVGPFLLFLLLMAGGIYTGVNITRNLAGDKPWVAYKEYRVAFDDVKGVVPGRVELRIAGVKSGSIAKSEVVDGRAVLTIKLEKHLAPLYRDAKLRIRPITPLEDMYVNIESRGHQASGELGSQILAAERTVAPVEIGKVLNVLNADTRNHMATLLQELGRGLDDRGAKLRAAFVQTAPFLRSVQQLSEALAERRGNLARVVHNIGGITDKLANRDVQLSAFVSSGEATLAELASNDAPFAATLAALPRTLSSVRSSFADLQKTEDRLDPALRALHPVAKALPGGLASLHTLATEARPALRDLRPAARSLRPLARVVQPASAVLSEVFGQLKHEAPQVDRSTKLVVPCRELVGKFFNRFISFSKFGDGEHNYANTRDLVAVDFNAAGGLLKDPKWHIIPPCFTATGVKP